MPAVPVAPSAVAARAAVSARKLSLQTKERREGAVQVTAIVARLAKDVLKQQS